MTSEEASKLAAPFELARVGDVVKGPLPFETDRENVSFIVPWDFKWGTDIRAVYFHRVPEGWERIK